MKILIVNLVNAHPDHLLENESLESVRSLMVAGCYGRLRDLLSPVSDPFEVIRNHLASQGLKAVHINHTEEGESWSAARSALEEDGQDYLQIDASVTDGDEGLGTILGLLTDETVVLAVSSNEARYEAFVLASIRNPLSGEVENTRLRDLVPTVLELAGFEIPESIPGRSLVSGLVVTSSLDDEEQLVRDRLRGLGYIA